MGTNYIAPIWRMPRNANKDKLSNYSINFSGGGTDYIIVGSSTELDNVPSNPYSFSFWFKQPSHTGSKVLSEKRATSTFFNAQYSIHSENGFIAWYGGAGSLSAVYTSSDLSDNEWHHIVCVAESTTVSKIYVDGQLNATSSDNRINSAVVAGTFNIGANYGGSYRFIGQLSQYCIFDYALDSTQVSYLYNLNNPMVPGAVNLTAPVAYWPLGDNSNPNSPGSFPNISVGADSVFDFDSSGPDYITTPGIDIGKTNTLSFWIKRTAVANQVILNNNANNAWYNYIVRLVSNGDILYATDVNGASTTFDNANTRTLVNALNVWTNIVIVRTEQNAVCYVNNQNNDGVKTLTNNNWPTVIDNIGVAGDNASFPFNGELSNIQLWNTDLSSNEVEAIYNNGQPLMTGTQPQEANLKAWYKLNQTANWEADTAGNWQIPDAVSSYPQSFDFGTRTQAEYIALNQLPLYNAITVSAWIKTQKNGSTKQTIISNSQPNAIANEKGWQLAIDQAWSSGYTKAGFVFYDSTGSTAITIAQTSSQDLTDNKWHHVVALWDGTTNTNAAKIFVDGLLAGQGTSSFTGPIGQPVIGLEPRIGSQAYSTSGGGNYFGGDGGEDGFISNVQTWDSSLTYGTVGSIGDVAGEQIAELYNNGSPLTTAIATDNLKLWAKLDNTATFSTNWSVPDASGNGNTGTSSGMTEQNLVNNNVSVLNGESVGMTTANLVTSNISRTQPYSNYSFNFDSASLDYFDLGGLQGTALQPSNTTLVADGFSVSAWVNLDDTSTRTFWQNDGLGNANYYGLIFLMNSGGQLNIGYNNGGTAGSGSRKNYITTAVQITSTGTWYHVVAIYKGIAVTPGLYVNGVEITAFNTPTGSATTLAYSSSAKGSIGVGRNAIQPMEGKISNCACFNRTLTQDEVLNIYNNGVPQDLQTTSSFSNNIVAWWPMDGSNSYYNGTNWVIRDLENGKDGTGVNTGNINDLVGNAPGSNANGTGNNLTIADLKGNMYNSDKNAYSINMADYADGVTNPANSGRSTDTP